MKLERRLSEFQNPGSAFRALPFWAWDARLEEAELRRQIRQMKQAGMGGFFMHSREGLETPYMGEEWKRCIRAACDEARRQGMQAWLYDEDRWPSGTAGGRVARIHGDDARAKGLTLDVCPPAARIPTDEPLLAAYAARVSGMELHSLRRLPLGMQQELDAGETLLLARCEVSGKCEWFGGEAPPDLLNPNAVRYFIEETHAVYHDLVGDYFGETVPGIFTDEPSLHDRHAAFCPTRGWIPWTADFGEVFAARRGYDPLDLLPHLYFQGEKSAKIRHDYWRSITERYVESFSGVIGPWCREHGLLYTGHFLQEDKLGLCVRCNGGIMPHYRLQDMPGIDMLTERTEEYLTVKQCSSIAHQYGKPAVLSETYGCTGWAFTFEGQKWVGDWQFALGVNRLSLHLALYSIKGCRKRDYPPSFNDHNTWYAAQGAVSDYFARLSAVLTGGEPVRDVLVLHPLSTAWSRLGCSPYGNPSRRDERDVPGIDEYGYRFNAFLKHLSGIHYDYDLGDETLLAEDAVIQDGGTLCAGSAGVRYRAVLMPPVDTLLRSTVELLRMFLDAGGRVIAVRPLPTLVEGEPCAEAAALFAHPNGQVAEDYGEAGRLLETVLARRVSITDEFGREVPQILYLLEDLGEGEFALLLVNNDRERAADVCVRLPGFGNIRRLDPLSGGMREQPFTARKEGVFFRDTLAGADSRLYLLCAGEAGQFGERVQVEPNFTEELYLSLPPLCPVRRTMVNALTLDRCRFRMEGMPWSEELEVWRAQELIRQRLCMRPIHLNGILQRYQWISKPHSGDGAAVRLLFEFESAEPLAGVQLVLEEAEAFSVYLNGIEVACAPNGWFLDRSMQRVALPALLRGKNVVELRCAYQNRMELEDCYLIGDFAVDLARRLTAEPPILRTGDWTLQGYPHYAGSMLYTYRFATPPRERGRVVLRPGRFMATGLRVHLGGRMLEMPWPAAAQADITDMLCAPGRENELAIEVLGSPRNLFGPFHTAQGEPVSTHDASFRTLDAEYSADYRLQPYGLLDTPSLYFVN